MAEIRTYSQDLEDALAEALDPLNAFVGLFEMMANGGIDKLTEDNVNQFEILGSTAHDRVYRNFDTLIKAIEEKLGKIEIEKAHEHEPGIYREGDIVDIKFKPSKRGGGHGKGDSISRATS